MMQKRTALKLVLAGAAAAMLAGCGDKTEAPKEAAAQEKAAAAPADKAAGPYKVAYRARKGLWRQSKVHDGREHSRRR